MAETTYKKQILSQSRLTDEELNYISGKLAEHLRL